MKELEEKYIKEIKETCTFGDQEGDHIWADKIIMDLLKELGMNELVETFENIDKWYA